MRSRCSCLLRIFYTETEDLLFKSLQTVIRLLAECLKQYKMQLKRLGILGIIWTEELYFGGQLSGKVV